MDYKFKVILEAPNQNRHMQHIATGGKDKSGGLVKSGSSAITKDEKGSKVVKQEKGEIVKKDDKKPNPNPKPESKPQSKPDSKPDSNGDDKKKKKGKGVVGKVVKGTYNFAKNRVGELQQGFGQSSFKEWRERTR